MSISTVSETAILQLIFNATNWALLADNTATTPMTNISVSLQTADPLTGGTMATNEVTYTGYVRANVLRTTGGWAVTGGNPASVSPVANINFPAGTGGSGVVTNFTTGKTGGGRCSIVE